MNKPSFKIIYSQYLSSKTILLSILFIMIYSSNTTLLLWAGGQQENFNSSLEYSVLESTQGISYNFYENTKLPINANKAILIIQSPDKNTNLKYNIQINPSLTPKFGYIVFHNKNLYPRLPLTAILTVFDNADVSLYTNQTNFLPELTFYQSTENTKISAPIILEYNSDSIFYTKYNSTDDMMLDYLTSQLLKTLDSFSGSESKHVLLTAFSKIDINHNNLSQDYNNLYKKLTTIKQKILERDTNNILINNNFDFDVFIRTSTNTKLIENYSNYNQIVITITNSNSDFETLKNNHLTTNIDFLEQLLKDKYISFDITNIPNIINNINYNLKYINSTIIPIKDNDKTNFIEELKSSQLQLNELITNWNLNATESLKDLANNKSLLLQQNYNNNNSLIQILENMNRLYTEENLMIDFENYNIQTKNYIDNTVLQITKIENKINSYKTYITDLQKQMVTIINNLEANDIELKTLLIDSTKEPQISLSKNLYEALLLLDKNVLTMQSLNSQIFTSQGKNIEVFRLLELLNKSDEVVNNFSDQINNINSMLNSLLADLDENIEQYPISNNSETSSIEINKNENILYSLKNYQNVTEYLKNYFVSVAMNINSTYQNIDRYIKDYCEIEYKITKLIKSNNNLDTTTSFCNQNNIKLGQVQSSKQIQPTSTLQKSSVPINKIDEQVTQSNNKNVEQTDKKPVDQQVKEPLKQVVETRELSQATTITDINIIGTSQLNSAVILKFINKKLTENNLILRVKNINYLINTYINESQIEQVNADVAIAQMLVHTNYLSNNNLLKNNNPVGLGSSNLAWKIYYFANLPQGIRAHIQHLKAYASTIPIQNTIVDPRYEILKNNKQIGTAPTLTSLAGKWYDLKSTKVNDILQVLYEMYSI